MSYRARVKPEVDVEEFTDSSFVTKVRDALLKLFIEDLKFPHDYRVDRLLTELTREICLSRM